MKRRRLEVAPPPLPVPEEMVAPGQRLLATGNDGDLGFADLSYRHEDSTWCQRHTVCLSGWVITAQATEAQAEEIFAIATRLARRVSA